MPLRPGKLKRVVATAKHEPEPHAYGQGRGGRPWRRLRDQIMMRDGGLCQCDACRARLLPRVAHEIDHIDNTRDGAGRLNDHPSNLRAMNRDCHAEKTQAEAARARERKTRLATPKA